MGQSLSKLYIHLVYSTKNRYPFITDPLEVSLHKYISGILANLNSPVLAIDSMPDHLHILFKLSKNYSLAKTVEEVKKSSSKWMKSEGSKSFSWQPGYAAFSVSQSNVEVVARYIHNQKFHHKRHSFQEEVEEFMREYEIEEYDKEHFWKE